MNNTYGLILFVFAQSGSMFAIRFCTQRKEISAIAVGETRGASSSWLSDPWSLW